MSRLGLWPSRHPESLLGQHSEVSGNWLSLRRDLFPIWHKVPNCLAKSLLRHQTEMEDGGFSSGFMFRLGLWPSRHPESLLGQHSGGEWKLVESSEGFVPNLARGAKLLGKIPSGPTFRNEMEEWWSRRDLNPRPPRCERGALPLSYCPTAGRRLCHFRPMRINWPPIWTPPEPISPGTGVPLEQPTAR